MPDSVTVIEESAFEEMWELQKVQISPNVKKLEDYLFFYCMNLETVEIPEGVTEIGSNVFADSSLKELKGQEVSILSYIDPLVAVLVSTVILGEAMTLMQGLGGLLILGFTLLNELSPKEKQKTEAAE